MEVLEVRALVLDPSAEYENILAARSQALDDRTACECGDVVAHRYEGEVKPLGDLLAIQRAGEVPFGEILVQAHVVGFARAPDVTAHDEVRRELG